MKAPAHPVKRRRLWTLDVGGRVLHALACARWEARRSFRWQLGGPLPQRARIRAE